MNTVTLVTLILAGVYILGLVVFAIIKVIVNRKRYKDDLKKHGFDDESKERKS